MAEEMNITAKIEACNFRPSDLRPRKIWSKLQEDFLEIYNDYCEISNPHIEELNEMFGKLNPEKEESDKEGTDLEDELQNYKYGAFMMNAFNQYVFEANQKHPDSYLSGFITMDMGGSPVFEARIKQYPELVMRLVVNVE